jgi:flagellar biosynthesis protein FlhG
MSHAARSRAGRIIAVASGKGGVGKTWFAITLAHALTRNGLRVLLFDGDLGLANVDVQLGLMPTGDLGEVICGRMPLERSVLHHDGGFDVLPGRSGSGSLASLDPPLLERVLDALREAAARYDVIVADLGAGLGRAQRRMASFADTLLVVVTEEPTSLTDAYAVLKRRGRAYIAALQRACGAFLGRTPPLAGIIRRDDRVRDAIRRQSLFLTRHPTTHAAADVEAIAPAGSPPEERRAIPHCAPLHPGYGAGPRDFERRR